MLRALRATGVIACVRVKGRAEPHRYAAGHTLGGAIWTISNGAETILYHPAHTRTHTHVAAPRTCKE
jgi:Cft2 family RNA processing exonuclease